MANTTGAIVCEEMRSSAYREQEDKNQNERKTARANLTLPGQRVIDRGTNCQQANQKRSDFWNGQTAGFFLVKLISVEFRSYGGRGGDGGTKYAHDFLLHL